MYSKVSTLLRRLALPALGVVLASCDVSDPTPLSPTGTQLRSHSSSSPSATLLECPTDLSVSSGLVTINNLGGTIEVTDAFGGKHAVIFPADAVSVPTQFRLTVPASQYVKVDVTAYDVVTGQATPITFPANAQPTLAVSYKRCTRNNTTKGPLHLYNVDPATNHVLEGPFGAKEGGTTDPRVVGKVPHFTEYGVGAP